MSEAKSQELYSPAGEPARREVKSTKSKVNAILWDLRGSLIAYVVVTLGFVPCMAMEVGGMKWKAWYTLWVTVVVLVSLVGDVFEDAGLAFLLGLMLLTVAGVITIAEAVAGFGDKLVCAIALLYVASKVHRRCWGGSAHSVARLAALSFCKWMAVVCQQLNRILCGRVWNDAPPQPTHQPTNDRTGSS